MTSKPKTVLIIDDDSDFVKAIQALLESSGFKVRSAENGREGLQLAKTIQPDLILLDVLMSERTEGFFVLQQMRRIRVLNQTPVIVLSSIYSDEPAFRIDRETGWLPANLFLAKPVDHGFDLFLSDLGDDYLVLVGTSRGDDIVAMSHCLMQKPTPADFAEYKRRSRIRRDAYKTHLDLEDLPEILEMEYQSEVWEEMGECCLSCGSCSMVCPTCYCFDVNDEVEFGSRNGQRIRSWDSCLLKTHAMVAGGENFRGARSSRVKFRYYHKQRGFVAEYGRPSCVGCGRCVEVCPAEINIITVIKSIRGERDGIAVSAHASS